jgi:hypothetical protein
VKALNTVPPVARSKGAAFAAFAGAVMSIFLMDFLTSVVPVLNGYPGMGVAVAIYFLLATIVGRLFNPDFAWYLFLILAGIGIGVFIDAIIVEMYLHRSRNLWPFAAIIYWALATVPAMLGLLSGEQWRRRHVR